MRIMAMFPQGEQAIVRVRLAESLHAVISQRLLPRADGKGRSAACEVMVVTPTIRDLIIDGDRMPEIKDYISEGKEQYGMQTFDQHLKELVAAGDVSYEVALANSSNPNDFELQMRTFGGMSKASPKKNGGGPATSGAAQAAPADVFGGGIDFLNP